MKNYVLGLACLCIYFAGHAQENKPTAINPDKPTLVVGVVVDQMRYDYLTRFWNQYGNDGFKRIISEGYNFKNNNFNYIPTYTAPGHASIFTGTTPENHGIISNSWYDKKSESIVYCVGDTSYQAVGTKSPAGQMSPHRLLTTTITDENRLFTQYNGKTIGISLKDRGAVLPAGHTANAAYWFHGDSQSGNWITSTFYMKELPKWVRDFNSSDKAKNYMQKWETLKDINLYAESGLDKNDFEGGFRGQENASFPYDLAALMKENGGYDMIKATPFGNSITTDFAIAALKAEDLGKDDFTDFLTVSFSSTDYIGHNFGVDSKEIEDAYLRLDKDLGRLLKALDEQVGKGNYTLFLTADHGGGDVSSYLESRNIPAGYFDDAMFLDSLKKYVLENFKNENLIENVSNNQVFFNYSELNKAKISSSDLENSIARFALNYPQVSKAYTREQLAGNFFENGTASQIQKGFNQKLSGDVVIVLEPSTVSYSKTGSMHGSGFSYDTHVPLLFFGKGVKHGSTTTPSYVVDIAPTVASILGIEFPNATTGNPLYIMLDN